MQKEIDKLKNNINELDNDTSIERWRNKFDGKYFYLSDEGYCCTGYDYNCFIDKHRYMIGNYFKTISLVSEYRDNIITKQKLKDLANGLAVYAVACMFGYRNEE